MHYRLRRAFRDCAMHSATEASAGVRLTPYGFCNEACTRRPSIGAAVRPSAGRRRRLSRAEATQDGARVLPVKG